MTFYSTIYLSMV